MTQIISWNNPLFDVHTLKNVPHNVTSIHVDRFSDMVKVNIEKGLEVTTINISMEQAQNIGFINVKALINYCK